MRQLDIQVLTEEVGAVLRLAEEHRAFSPSHDEIQRDGEPGWSEVRVNLPNEEVGPFVTAVGDAVSEAEFVLATSGTLPIRTPVEDIRDRVSDVSTRSTFELVLDVLQSVGTWKGMLLYAAVSGVVAAYGVIFGLPYLLTAAMLIAPLGAPVMVCVIGVTLGDAWMVRRGGARFAVSLLMLAGTAALLGFAYGLDGATPMMETISNLSAWSGLLGVVGGAAGAQALARAERDSLVTATATGFLVAVSLSPPSAVLGLALVLGRWDHVALMALLLALTAAGIVVGGWASFRSVGVVPGRPSVRRGRRTRARTFLVAASVALAGLWLWQVGAGPGAVKADRAREAARLTREVVERAPGYEALTVEPRFTPGRSDWHPGEGLLLDVVVKRTGGSAGDAAPPSEQLRAAIRDRVAERMEGVRPFVDLSIVP